MSELEVAEATNLAVDALVRCGASKKNADSVARALIAAELSGQGGHGLRRIPSYCAQALSGKVDARAVPVIEKRRPSVLNVDAANGFAYPAIDLALGNLPGVARQQGVALAGIRRSHHCGVAGVIVERLAEMNYIALLFANTPSAIAPWGGKTPLFGTDPIAFAAPAGEGGPVVVDISLSKVARGKIMEAKQKNVNIPEGWAFDRDGNPTTNPDFALEGTMVPMGDAKGTALALMVELLCAGLTGANYGYEATSFFDGDGQPPGTGQLIIVIDPEVFGGVATARFAELARLIDAMPGARVPGRRRQALKAELLKQGIQVDNDLLAQISGIGR